MPEAVIYPPTITADKDKLFACYSLVKQMIDEYNKQGAIARSNPAKYISSGQFKVYTRHFEKRLEQVLAERNRLIEKIRWANYTPNEWKQVSKLDDGEQEDICEALFGDKEAEKVKPTEATSPLLDELKAINLDSLPQKASEDPVEGFTSLDWNEGTPQSDPNSRLTITSNKVTATGLTKNEDCYFYRDRQFDGDFEHLSEIYCTSLVDTSRACFWALTNVADDIKDIANANEDALTGEFYKWNSTQKLRIHELDGGTWYSDVWNNLVLSTLYYLKIKRDESIGTYGTIYMYIYDDEEELITTLSVALHSSKKDFSKIFSVCSYNSGDTEALSFYIQNLDLQELTKYPGTISTEDVIPEDDNDWDNPSNIGAYDGNYAEVTHPTFDTGDITYRLKAQNFGFNIPEGATIDGIMVEIMRHCDAGETGKDYRVSLLDANGSLVGYDKADTVNNWPTTPTIKFYGGSRDTWNASPTRAMVNDADFGVVLSVEATADNADIYVDFIRITIYYTGGVQHYYRTGVALLGLAMSGSRGLALSRADMGLLGLLASGSRVLDLARGDTALLGLKTTATRAMSYLRSNTALLGLKTTASKALELARSKTALLGLKGIGSRTIDIGRLDTALLGLKATATRTVNYTRTKTALLGLKSTATRSIALSRSKTALLGLLATGSRTIDIARSGTALLGLKATGIMSTAKHYFRTGVAYLGLVATGARSITLARTNIALLGLKTTATRAISITRTGTTLLGLKATGVMSTFKHYIRTGIAYLGLVATGSRQLTLSRISTALLGLKGIASRTIAIGRSGTALLGLKGIASKVVSYVQAYVALRRAYVVELRNGDGDLVAILENAHGINYSQIINGPYSLSFEIPSDDSKASNIILANEIWLRDTRTNTVVRKFRLQKTTESRA